MYEFEMSNHTFQFIFQPIVQVEEDGTKRETVSYEMLLRDKETGKFPKEFFTKILDYPFLLEEIYPFYVEMMTRFLQNHETSRINVNIDPKQFLAKSTFRFFDELCPFSDRITIEVTEGPLKEGVSSMMFLHQLIDSLTYLHDIGYMVALDDVGTGEHTMAFVEAICEKVSFLKFTILPLSDLPYEESIRYLKKWRTFAQGQNLPMIIEGIETKKEANEFAKLGYCLQQGYYWSK